MVDIPEELARSIQSGDCVLWFGAGVGQLARRPSWEQLLRQVVDDGPPTARDGLTDLLEQGRLRTVLAYVHRHHGDEPLAAVLRSMPPVDPDQAFDEVARTLGALPWRACFSTTYADVVRSLFAAAGREPAVLSHTEVHHLSLRDQQELFVLKTPPTGRAMRADRVLFDFVEEVVRTRTIFFVGFEPDDPDLAQILDLFDRIGPGNRHFAALPLMSAPESEEWRERFGIEVVHTPDGLGVPALFEAVQRACSDVAVRPTDTEGKLAILDLSRAVRGVDPRADLGVDDALALDPSWIEHLLDALPGGSLGGVPAGTALQAGAVLLAHRRIDRARRCFQHVISSGAGREFTNLARFDLALTSLAEGDRPAALDGLSDCAASDRSLAIVPPRFQLEDVQHWSGTLLLLKCRDRSSKELFDIVVATMGRPVGHAEQAQFTEVVQALTAVQHPAVCRARGGFADGRLFGVMYESVPGFGLDETLTDQPGPMTFDRGLEIVRPLIDGLEVCHARGVLHCNLNPANVLIGPGGPMLRAFGFPPVIAPARPSVQRDNRGYAAPELALGAQPTPHSDVYSLAALLYRCLTGDVPRGSVPAPSRWQAGLDPRLDGLLEAGLHPDPAQRLSLTAFREQLEHIASTPELGRAQRLIGEEADPGEEKIVDLGPPRAGTSRAAAGAGKIALPDDENDLDAWSSILQHKPTHYEARQAITRIEADARQSGRWDRVAEVLKIRARHTQVQRERLDLLREQARLLERELGAPASAFDVNLELLEAVEASAVVEVLSELRRLADVSGQWTALAEAMSIGAERQSDPDVRAETYAELGRLSEEKLGDLGRALQAWQKAAEVRPSPESLGAVAALLERVGEPAERAAALLSLADVVEGSAKHDALVSAAAVMREHLSDDEGALATVELVLAEAPRHPQAVRAAESLARALGRADVLSDALARRAELEQDPAVATEARREAAELALQAGQRGRAIELLHRIVELDRSDRKAASKLLDLLREGDELDASQRAALVDALDAMADSTGGADAKAKLLLEQADLLEREAEGSARAIDCWEEVLSTVALDREPAQRAANALVRTYRRRGDNARLAGVLERIARFVDLAAEARADAYKGLLDLRKSADDQTIGEVGEIEALEALVKLEPSEGKWQDELIEKYLARQEFQKAGPLIRARVDAEDDPRRKAALLRRGGVLRAQIGKTEGAIEALEEATSLEPAAADAWLALRELYEQTDQPLKAVDALVQAARCQANRGERARMLFEAARAYIERLDRSERGLEILEEVVEADPDHREAATLLVERLVAANAMQRAWPYAQTLVTLVKSQLPSDAKANHRAAILAARCALAVGDATRGRDYLDRARSYDATNLEILKLLGDLDLDAQRWEEALKSYQSVVLGAGDGLAKPEQSDLYVRMGQARVGLGETAKAGKMFERALEIDPSNETAAQQLVDVTTKSGKPEELVAAKLRLSAVLARRIQQSKAEAATALRSRQADVLLEIADLQIKELGQLDAGIDTLRRVRATNPEDHALGHRVLEKFTEHERWDDAVSVLADLADAQPEGALKAKYLYAGAAVLRDNVGDRKRAIEWFSRVLAADPNHAKAFEAQLVELRKAGSWKELAKAIRTHLKQKATEAEPGRLAALFDELGDAYEKLGEPKTALAAYDQAAKFAAKAGEEAPDLKQRRLRIMDMAIELGEDELDKAIAQGHALIVASPMEFDVYHRLAGLYLQRGQRERARCFARTLKFLRQADDAELELAGGRPGQARGTLTREQWRRNVYAPGEDPRLSDIFALVWPVVAAREGRTFAQQGLSRSERDEVSLQSPLAVARYVAHACQVFDAPVPDLYRRDDFAGSLRVDALTDGSAQPPIVVPVIVAGRESLTDPNEPTMKFRAGRAVARIKPEHVATAVLSSSTNLRHVVWGAIAMTHPGAPIPPDVGTAAVEYATRFGPYLQPARLDQLRSLCAPLAEAGDVDTKAWLQGVTYTINRAGLLLCDSIEAAAQIVTREGEEGSAVSVKDLIRDLVAYSVSEPYLRLRRDLGLER